MKTLLKSMCAEQSKAAGWMDRCTVREGLCLGLWGEGEEGDTKVLKGNGSVPGHAVSNGEAGALPE